MKKYWTVFHSTVQKALMYRFRSLTWTLISSTQPMIMIAIWSKYYESGGVLGNQSLSDVVGYYLLVIFFGMWTPKVGDTVDDDIRNGELSNYIIKPFNYAHFRLAWEVGWYSIKTVPLLPILLLIIYRFAPDTFASLVTPDGWLILAKVLSFILMYLLSFYMSLAVGSLAFFITETSGVKHVFSMLGELLTGKLFPLVLFPAGILPLVSLSPFAYTISFPVEVFRSQVNSAALWNGIAIQAMWVLVFIGLYRLIWRAGIKKFSAIGL